MSYEWQDDDEVVTTFGSIKLSQAQSFDAGWASGYAAGIAWAKKQLEG